ncbi:MAG: hypothetical protein RL318_2016 [Fibrobacterota bacterium]
MKKIALSAAALAVLATGVRADYSFVFPTSAADSAAVNAAIPCKSYDEKKGTTTALSASAGAIKLSATWGAVPAWGAAAGILLPINKMWTPVDFSGVTSVTFSYKTGDAKTAIEFAPNSPLYLGAATDNGVMMLAPYAGSVAFKKVTVGLPDGIAFADWMITQEPAQTETTWDDVKTEIKLLQFSPKPVYNATGSAITGAAVATLEIKDVSIQGDIKITTGNIDWLKANGTGCAGNLKSVLSNFNGDFTGVPNKNTQGGYWFAFTDTTSGTPGPANGASTLFEDDNTIQGMQFIPGDEANRGVAGITATLSKGDATLHPYAGWADIGTGFKDKTTGDDTYLDLTGLKGISFSISMADGFDEANLTGVIVKLGNKSVGDSVQYSAGVPYTMNNQTICIDTKDFTQPTWYTSKNGGAKPLPLKDLGKIMWELKINSDKTASAATSSFYIGDVTFWGASVGISNQKVGGKSALVANYSKGLTLSYALEGASAAKIDIVRMDGSKVASFDGAAKASNQSFNVSLARGTYLAVVKGGKTNLVAPFAVAK